MSETKSENEYYSGDGEEDMGDKDIKNVKATSNPFSKLESKMKVMTDVNDTDDEEDNDGDDDADDDADEDDGVIGEEGDDEETGDLDDDIDDEEEDEDDEEDDDDDDDDDDDADDGDDKSTISLKKSSTFFIDDGNDNDNDEEDDSKKDDSLLKSYILEQKNYMKLFHPECSSISFEEVKMLSVVIRNSFGIVIDGLHRTIPILTKYEKARIIGLRTYHLDDGDEPYISDVRLIAGMSNSDIALLEMKMKLLPYIVRRPFPDGKFEYWKLIDLEIF